MYKYDGGIIVKNICMNCGTPIESDNNGFCAECGSKIETTFTSLENNNIPNSASQFPNEIVSQANTEYDESGFNEGTFHTNAVVLEKDINESNESGEEIELEIETHPNLYKKSGKKKIIIIIAIIVAVILGVIVMVTSSFKSHYEECLLYMHLDKYMMYSEAADAEEICILVSSVWHDAIWDDYDDETKEYVLGAEDFNEAVMNVYADIEIINKINEMQDEIDDVEENMSKMGEIPEELSSSYDAFVELYIAYKALVDCAVEPSGNYSEFTSNFQSKVDDFLDAYNKLDVVLPELEDSNLSE